MKVQRRRGYRWLAGLFCVSLILCEVMSAGMVVSAQEAVPAVQNLTVQNNEGIEQRPGGEEGDGEEKSSGDEGENTDDGERKNSGDEGENTDDGEGENPGVEDGGEKGDSEGGNPGGEEGDGESENSGGEEGKGEGENPSDEDGDEEEELPADEDDELSVSENTLEEDGRLTLLATGDSIASGTYGEVTWVFDASGKLTVKGKGEFAPDESNQWVPFNRAPWYEYREQIKSAEVQLTDVTSLSFMFYQCKNMTSLDLSGLQTESVTTMEAMFWECTSLKKLDLRNLDTGNVTDMNHMFYGCHGLTDLNLSSFDTGKVTDMSGMFWNCEELPGIDLRSFDTGNVTDMSNMFCGCAGLKGLDVSGFDTANVTNMDSMFTSCYVLTELDVSSFDTGNVTNMSGMFASCDDLKELNISNFDTCRVTDMSSMFRGCMNLTILDVSDFDTRKVTDMNSMFCMCQSLTTLDLSGFDTGSVTNMCLMFSFCHGLTDLDLSGFDTSNVTNMESMFRLCDGLTSLDLSGFDTGKVTDMSLMFHDCSSLTDLDVSGFDTGNVTNMDSMFDSCRSLTSLDVSGFDTAKVTDMRCMFELCDNLTTLDVSGFDTANVTKMSGMFDICESLTELDVSNFNTANVTDMAYMFRTCRSLTELDLSNFNTSKVEVMGRSSNGHNYGMFEGCKSLERLDLSSFDTSNVTEMVNMFYGCESLTELDLSSFDMGKITKEDRTSDFLKGCKKLETIYTPLHVKVDINLPKAETSDIWRGIINGEQNVLADMPVNLDYSVLLVKNKEQVKTEERIQARKGRTAYTCGELLSVEDLKVTYYDAAGGIRTLEMSDYTTNAEDIEMSTAGEKILTVTYRKEDGTELTAQIRLQVTYALTADNTTITLPEGESYVYTGQPVTPVPIVVCRAVLKEGSPETVTLEEGKDYTVSYRSNINVDTKAPTVVITGTGDYSGKLTKSFSIGKAAAPAAETLVCYAPDCESAADRTLNLSESFEGCGSKTGYHIESVTEDDTIVGAVFAKEPTDADIIRGKLNYSTNAGTPGDHATVKLIVSFANYEDAELTVRIIFSEERVAYLVTYDPMGHGGYMTKSVKAGSTLEEPEPLTADGYLFTGWYTDRGLTKKWDFAVNTVQEDITLYAGWLSDRSGGILQMYVQDIEDMTYTGSALKPAVIVYDNDGKTLLKAGKDYTVKYYNNVNAGGTAAANAVARVTNPGKKNEEITGIVPGRGTEDGQNPAFTKDAPYIAIMGKGNYSETIYKNFCIQPTDIGTKDGAPAQGITLKYTEQMATNVKKEQKPFSSLKYKKAMKSGVDFQVSLSSIDARDEENNAVPDWKAESSQENKQNPAIPKGYSGTFLLTVRGQGNYTGEIRRTVIVAEQAKLIKNVSITLGKNQKSLPYTGRAVTLTPGYYHPTQKLYYTVGAGGSTTYLGKDGKDVFLVKTGNTALLYDKDYTVSYVNNIAVGTATMTITGKNGYVGSKSITFKITGSAFTTGNILVKAYDMDNPNENDFKSSMPYTGKAVVQNRVTLTTKATKANPNSKQLVYGEHYTISYKNNVKKGTATMIFTAKPESGYSGNFKKTFKITAQELSGKNLTVQKAAGADSGTEIQVFYCKNGAFPDFTLTNEAGTVLKQGTDYTVKCKNNTAVTTAQTLTNKKPVMTITGKGSYTGKIEVPFTIVPESIERAVNEGIVSPSCASVMKKENIQFKDFKFKLVEGKKTLAVGETKDYTLDTAGCTPEVIKAYADALASGTASEQSEPTVTVKGTGTNYTGTTTVKLGKYLYALKLDNRCLYVVVAEGKGQNIYTGSQLKPDVTVYYGEAKAVSEAKKAKERDNEVLTAQNGNYKLVKLTEKTAGEAGLGDYTLDYGVNTAAGKNKGSVRITGAGKYGGSITVKFNIEKKPVYDDAGK